jgi:ferritin-like metal-binding protein YciE
MRDLLIEELRDLYDAEKQLIEALPKMSRAATSPELKSAFDHHLHQTRDHLTRLKSVFSDLGEKPTGEVCDAMQGLIKEGENMAHAKGNDDVRDAGLIGAAQRVEHYEMAGYGTARALARQLGDDRVAEMLQTILKEEGEANEKLTSIAEKHVNVSAALAK